MLFNLGLLAIARRTPAFAYKQTLAAPLYRTLFTNLTLRDPTRLTDQASTKTKKTVKPKTGKPAAKESTTTKTKAKPGPKPKKKKAKKPEEPRLYSPPPKKPLTGYFRFCVENDRLPRGQGAAILEAAKENSAAWKVLSDAEKEVYSLKAKAGLEQYRLDLAAWEASQSPEALAQYRKEQRKKRVARKARHPAGHLSRPAPPFVRYFSEFHKSFDKDSIPEDIKGDRKAIAAHIAKACGHKWNEMTVYEKSRYEHEYREALAKYREERDAAIAAAKAEKASKSSA
jgi:hypothetical protein